MKCRSVLTIVIAMVAAAVVGCSNCDTQSQRANQDTTLVGAWRARIQFTEGAFSPLQDLEFMYVFNAGGTMTESSNYDAAPPVPPAYGIWRKAGSNQYEIRYEFYATRIPDTSEHMPAGSGWLPAGRGVFIENISVSTDGDSYTSDIRYEIFDQTGEKLQDRGSGRAVGTRMKF